MHTRILVTTAVLALSGGAWRTTWPAAQSHQEHQAHRVETIAEGQVAITRVVRGPDHFVGNLAFDRETSRLWLIAYGPPANTVGPSTIYEIDPDTGRVLASATLPFQGELAGAAYMDGWLYQAVSYESTLYKLAVRRGRDFGRVAGTFKLPTHLDVGGQDDDVYRFPFIAFTSATAIPGAGVLLYAADLGEFLTLDAEGGSVVRRVRTAKGLAGISAVTGRGGRPLVLATFDPVDAAFKQETRRFMFRASHGILPLETVRAEGNYGTPGQKTVTWVLLDPQTGEVLASTPMESTRIDVGSVAVVRRDDVQGTRYGRFVALTTGDEGILTVEWTPR